jgi:type II secretory pathway component PulJ
MTRYLIAALAIGCLALGGLAWFWQDRASTTSAALALANARLQQVQQAEAVHRAHIARMEAEAARWSELENDLQAMEGRDAPLSDPLAAAARRLWGAK